MIGQQSRLPTVPPSSADHAAHRPKMSEPSARRWAQSSAANSPIRDQHRHGHCLPGMRIKIRPQQKSHGADAPRQTRNRFDSTFQRQIRRPRLSMSAFRHAQAAAVRARRPYGGVCILRHLCHRRSESKRSIHGVDETPPFPIHSHCYHTQYTPFAQSRNLATRLPHQPCVASDSSLLRLLTRMI